MRKKAGDAGYMYEAIRRSVTDRTQRWALEFAACNEFSSAGFPHNLLVVVHDLSTTDRRLRKPSDCKARIRRELCRREHVCILYDLLLGRIPDHDVGI